MRARSGEECIGDLLGRRLGSERRDARYLERLDRTAVRQIDLEDDRADRRRQGRRGEPQQQGEEQERLAHRRSLAPPPAASSLAVSRALRGTAPPRAGGG